MKKQAQPNTITWIAFCLLAGLIGYNLGQLGPSEKNISRAPQQSSARVGGPSSLNNDHTVSNIASEAANWVVSVDSIPSRMRPQSGADPTLGVPTNQKSLSAGIIYSHDGYIVTSNHAIGVNHGINVILPSKQRVPAKLVGRDWNTDVALLKIENQSLQPARFGTNDATKSGDWAIAIGSPMRLDNSVSLGIVSAVNRIVESGPTAGLELIQTDAAINPGNSGGPLLNINGDVIAMNASVRSDAQNIAFAIPIETVRHVADDIIEHGAAQRGYLGVCIGSTAAQPEEEHRGALVIYAVKNSPATRSGVRTGDVIVAVDGVPIKRPADLNRFLATKKPGTFVDVSVLRDTGIVKVRVPLGEVPEEELDSNGRRIRSRPS